MGNKGEVYMKKSKADDYVTNKKSHKLLNRILFYISLAVFVISAGLLIYILVIEPMLNKSTNKEIQDIYYSETDDRSPLDRLKGINPDILGWIKIDNTPIDYPVLYSEYYLYRDYKKQSTKYGSIFIDNICKLENKPQNILLHGHHMNNGSMFAKICDFSDLNFYKSTPVFTFDTIYEPGKWKVISVFKTNTNIEHGELFKYLHSDFRSDHLDFLEYVYQVKIRSIIETPVDISKDDSLVTLSTCSYELPDFRTIVIARKVRPNESETVDVSLAKYNSSPLMPDVYYQKYGGSKPEVKSFKKALKENKINWYKET